MEEEVINNIEIISQLQSENKRYQTIVYEHEVRQKVLRQDIIKLVEKKQKEPESSRSLIKKSVISQKNQERYGTCTQEGEEESEDEEYSYDETEL